MANEDSSCSYNYEEENNSYNMEGQFNATVLPPSLTLNQNDANTLMNVLNASNLGRIYEDLTEERSELTNLLREWKLVHLVDHLLAQKVFVNVLRVIKRHHIEKLFKDIDLGTQIMFEHKLEEWRNSIASSVPLDAPHTSHFQTSSNLLLSSPMREPLSPTSSCSTEHSSRPATPEDESSNIHLANILNESSRGKDLMDFYTKEGRFQEEQRTALINLVAQYFDEKGISISLAASYRIEKEILQKFPSEKLEYYRTQKRGKLYTKCVNLKSSFRLVVGKSGKKRKIEKKSRHTQEFPPEIDAEICLRALKHENLSSEQFDNYWKACSNYRLKDLKESSNTLDFFSKWPFYKTPSGYRLIELDFDYAFQAEDFISAWEKDREYIIKFLTEEAQIKDRGIKAQLVDLKIGNHNQKAVDSVLLTALHGYLVPTSKSVKKKDGAKLDVTRYTIKDSQESFLFMARSHQEVEDHLSFLKAKKNAIQPFLLSIGSDANHIEDIIMFFDGIRYTFTSLLKAVEVCFKTYYLFDLDFPPESIMVWSLMEYHFFQINKRCVFPRVHILSEYLKSQ